MVPPVQPVLKVQHQDTVTRNVTILRHAITNDIFLEQMEHHAKWAPLEDDNSKVSDHDSIPSSLSKQLRDQSLFEASISDFKSDMEAKMKQHMEDLTALLTKNSLIDPAPKLQEAKDVLKSVDTDTTKLLGNIKKYETQVNDLRNTTDSLREIAAGTITSAQKDYTAARDSLLQLRDNTLKDLRHTHDELKKNNPLPTEAPPSSNAAFFSYLGPNECMVKNIKLSIRSDKFLDDPAPIKCGSRDEIS